MAAEPKKSPSSKMYGKGPRIDDAVTENEPAAGGAPEPRKTVSAGAGDTTRGDEPKGDVMAGTDGIPSSHHEQSRERAEMHHRHHAERDEMMHRHEREHLMRAMGHHHEKHAAMNERHEEERRKLNTRHEREHREMGERHEGMKNGPTGGIKEEGKKPDAAGDMK